VLPACCKIDMDALKAYLKAGEIVLADEEELAKLFGDCALGAEPPFGHLYGVTTLLDETLKKEPQIVFQAGTHELAIRMNMDDFIKLENPQVTRYSYHMQ
jgi:Ala-tRNA(Pro) deacylase